MERVYIAETLRRTNWVVGGRGGAAAKLGLPRTTLLSRMQKLGILRDQPVPEVAIDRIAPPDGMGHVGWDRMAQTAGV